MKSSFIIHITITSNLLQWIIKLPANSIKLTKYDRYSTQRNQLLFKTITNFLERGPCMKPLPIDDGLWKSEML